MEAEAKKGELGRFAPGLPKISDGQQLFVLNGLSKLSDNGRMAIVQNGSPLFSGDAGSGSSEIRRYIIENDWLDCIIQLSTDMFMNTGISTYIWVLNKNKPSYRCGKVQLIDASHCFEPRRKSIGSKRNDITDLCRDLIVKAYGDFRNDEIYGEKEKVYCQSKIFDNDEFGYYKIVVERPFRPTYSTAEDRICIMEDGIHIPDMFDDLRGFGEYDPPAYRFAKALRNIDQSKIFYDEKEFIDTIKPEFEKIGFSLDKFTKDYVVRTCCKHDPNAPIQYKKGKPVPNPDLRDTENVPMTEDIDEYFAREVLPYAPDAWIDKTKTKVGYEIPMTRYFYEYQAPEKVDDIMSRLRELESDIQTSLNALFGGDKP